MSQPRPVDPDVDADVDAGDAVTGRGSARSPGAAESSGAFARSGRSRWPRLHADIVAAVFVGGCAGGVLRYAATSRWPAAAGGFPWSTYACNVAGAFVLAVVVVVSARLRPARYLRPLLGTGVCGALTTFSSVVVATAELAAHHHAATAATYLVASVLGGLLAAWLGLVAARAVVVRPAASERTR